ncbi:SHOCT domain-containing protein [Nocardioides sediminis]|uniref:SHOCT domain-containing protein n=1 Tax=Nocardioides sediminis TaxID=433648 RepID=UPI000D3197B7|nr:SHOCT domain-containing protein [Nocardioides sediminis]
MPGLLRGVARTAVVAGTATAVSNRVSRRQAGRWAEQSAAQAPQQYAPEPQYAPPPQQYAAAPPPEEDPIEQLKELAALKEQGILTEAEFAQQKARILNR